MPAEFAWLAKVVWLARFRSSFFNRWLTTRRIALRRRGKPCAVGAIAIAA
jgi:hypothetical protein